MKEKLTVVKVGGAVVEDEAQLTQLLKDFSAIKGKKVLIHGGGRRATQVAASLGIESKMVGGRRITDADMLTFSRYTSAANAEATENTISYRSESFNVSSKNLRDIA